MGQYPVKATAAALCPGKSARAVDVSGLDDQLGMHGDVWAISGRRLETRSTCNSAEFYAINYVLLVSTCTAASESIGLPPCGLVRVLCVVLCSEQN